MSTTGQDEFAERLRTIRERGGQATIMVGQDEQYLIPRKERVTVSRRREVAGNMLYPASLLGVVLLGMVAVAVSHYVRFHIMAESALLQDPVSEMLMVGGVGLAATFVLSQAYKLTSKEHRTLQGIGVFLMVASFHNLSHWLPGPMSLVFSPAYVATIAETTPVNTLRLGGSYYQLFETPTADTAGDVVPTVANDAMPAETETSTKPKVRKGGKIVQDGQTSP